MGRSDILAYRPGGSLFHWQGADPCRVEATSCMQLGWEGRYGVREYESNIILGIACHLLGLRHIIAHGLRACHFPALT